MLFADELEKHICWIASWHCDEGLGMAGPRKTPYLLASRSWAWEILIRFDLGPFVMHQVPTAAHCWLTRWLVLPMIFTETEKNKVLVNKWDHCQNTISDKWPYMVCNTLISQEQISENMLKAGGLSPQNSPLLLPQECSLLLKVFISFKRR